MGGCPVCKGARVRGSHSHRQAPKSFPSPLWGRVRVGGSRLWKGARVRRLACGHMKRRPYSFQKRIKIFKDQVIPVPHDSETLRFQPQSSRLVFKCCAPHAGRHPAR